MRYLYILAAKKGEITSQNVVTVIILSVQGIPTNKAFLTPKTTSFVTGTETGAFSAYT